LFAVLGEGISLPDQFNWVKLELILAVMRYWFNELELSGRKVEPNDFYDFIQLMYVQPGELFWTLEKKWLK
jgi:hypothetical protein